MDAFIGIGKMHQSDAENEKEAGSMRRKLGFPYFHEKGKFFQNGGEINATLRYLCGSHECDEYLMTSHSYLHSNAFFLFQ